MNRAVLSVPRGILLFALLVGVTACAPVVSVSPTPSESAQPSAATDEECDLAAPPVLIGPDGDQVFLGSTYGSSDWVSDDGLTWALRQVGDCIWLVGYAEVDTDLFITSFFGHLGADFRIVGEFADLRGFLIQGYDHGQMVYEVTFEDSVVVLAEDRTDGGPPGCSGGDGACPEIRILRPAPD